MTACGTASRVLSGRFDQDPAIGFNHTEQWLSNSEETQPGAMIGASLQATLPVPAPKARKIRFES